MWPEEQPSWPKYPSPEEGRILSFMASQKIPYTAEDIAAVNWRYQVRLDKSLGLRRDVRTEKGPDGIHRVQQDNYYPEVPELAPYETLTAAYIDMTGDANLAYFGKPVRAIQVAGVLTFPQLLTASLNRMMIADYELPGASGNEYRWRDLATTISALKDFRPNIRGRLMYQPDVADLTEGDPFIDVQTSASDDEGVTFSVIQKGGALAFTRAVFINNDVGVIQRAVEQYSRAAWRTLARRVWNLLLSNSTYSVDGLNVFHANHGNVGSGALSSTDATALNAARAALFAQTEPGGTDRLGLGSGKLLLVVPIELEDAAFGLNQNPYYLTGSNVFTPNRWHHAFGVGNEGILVNPFMTDTNDWLLVDLSQRAQVIEVGFLGGQQFPQFIQSDPIKTDTAFQKDEVTVRIRHEYEAVVLDYRGVYKSVNA